LPPLPPPPPPVTPMLKSTHELNISTIWYTAVQALGVSVILGKSPETILCSSEQHRIWNLHAVRSPIKLCTFPGGVARPEGPAFRGLKWQQEPCEKRSRPRPLLCRDSKTGVSVPKLVHFRSMFHTKSILLLFIAMVIPLSPLLYRVLLLLLYLPIFLVLVLQVLVLLFFTPVLFNFIFSFFPPYLPRTFMTQSYLSPPSPSSYHPRPVSGHDLDSTCSVPYSCMYFSITSFQTGMGDHPDF
jgi:hypothetical protein